MDLLGETPANHLGMLGLPLDLRNISFPRPFAVAPSTNMSIWWQDFNKPTTNTATNTTTE